MRLGVKLDDAKAVDWYKRAADAGDREAHVRAGDASPGRPRRPGQRRGSRETAGVLGQARQFRRRRTIWRCSISTGRRCRRTSGARRNCCASPPMPATRKPQYALATFYKEGTGVPKDVEKSVRLLQAAALADNVEAEVEYAIALYNGTGTPREPACRGGAAAQGRQAKQSDRAKPPRLGAGERTGRADRQGRGAEMASRGENRRQRRPDARRGLLPISAPEDRAKAEAAARQWLGAK